MSRFFSAVEDAVGAVGCWIQDHIQIIGPIVAFLCLMGLGIGIVALANPHYGYEDIVVVTAIRSDSTYDRGKFRAADECCDAITDAYAKIEKRLEVER